MDIFIQESLNYIALLEDINSKIDYILTKQKNLTKNQIDVLINYDPTNKKIYLNWLVFLFLKSNENINQFEIKLKNSNISYYLNIFNNPKIKNALNEKDINKYKSIEELINAIKPLENIDALKTKSELTKQGLIFNFDNWLVYKINSFDHHLSLTKDTKWCTSVDNNSGRFKMDHYLFMNSGLYVFINKQDNKIKYEFSTYTFEFQNSDCKDEQPEQVFKSSLSSDEKEKLINRMHEEYNNQINTYIQYINNIINKSIEINKDNREIYKHSEEEIIEVLSKMSEINLNELYKYHYGQLIMHEISFLDQLTDHMQQARNFIAFKYFQFNIPFSKLIKQVKTIIYENKEDIYDNVKYKKFETFDKVFKPELLEKIKSLKGYLAKLSFNGKLITPQNSGYIKELITYIKNKENLFENIPHIFYLDFKNVEFKNIASKTAGYMFNFENCTFNTIGNLKDISKTLILKYDQPKYFDILELPKKGQQLVLINCKINELKGPEIYRQIYLEETYIDKIDNLKSVRKLSLDNSNNEIKFNKLIDALREKGIVKRISYESYHHTIHPLGN